MSEILTVAEVKRRVDVIRSLADDSEAAHVAESDLHTDVLSAIADGKCEDPASCAYEAIGTLLIPFGRWFA